MCVCACMLNTVLVSAYMHTSILNVDGIIRVLPNMVGSVHQSPVGYLPVAMKGHIGKFYSYNTSYYHIINFANSFPYF